VRGHLLRHQQQQAEQDQRRPDQVQVARAVLDLVLEGEPEDPDRDRADDDVEAELRVVVLARLAVRQPAQGGDGDPPQVVAFLLGPGGRSFTGAPVTMDLGWTAR